MSKIIMMLIWIFNLSYAISNIIDGLPVNPICACLGYGFCILACLDDII